MKTKEISRDDLKKRWKNSYFVFFSVTFILMFGLICLQNGWGAEDIYVGVLDYSYYPLDKHEDTEAVCFRFNRRCMPEVNSLSGEEPRVYFDLQPVKNISIEKKSISDSTMVQNVRWFLHKDNRLRMVIDLKKDFDYRIEQRYAKQENRLCFVICKNVNSNKSRVKK